MIISLILWAQVPQILRGGGLPPVPVMRDLHTAPASKPVIRTVEIGVHRYSVVIVDGQQTEISGGDAAMQRSETLAKVFRLAAMKATGCKVASDFWVDTVLHGKLNCSQRRIP